MCVFDEVRHLLKDHPYRKVALNLNHWSKGYPTVGGNEYQANKINNVKEERIKREKDIVPEGISNGSDEAIICSKYNDSGVTYADIVRKSTYK